MAGITQREINTYKAKKDSKALMKAFNEALKSGQIFRGVFFEIIRAISFISDRSWQKHHMQMAAALTDALSHPDDDMRREAACGLSTLKSDQNAVDALILALGDKCMKVRAEAASALSLKNWRAENYEENAAKSFDRLIECFQSSDDETKFAFLQAAPKLCWEQNLGRLKDLMLSAAVDDSPSVRSLSIDYLSSHGATTLDLLLPNLKDPNYFMRRTVAQGLAAFSNKEAIAALHALVRDESTDVQAAAVESLGTLRDQGAIQLITPLLESDSERVREAARKTLGLLGWRPEQSALKKDYFELILDRTKKQIILNLATGEKFLKQNEIIASANKAIAERFLLSEQEVNELSREAAGLMALAEKAARAALG